jgi:peptidoglycan L-alanyl-D-glutamate endopeptidase CwlK
MDKITEYRINTLHPIIREEVRELVTLANTKLKGNAQLRMTQAYRTFQEQNALYAIGRTKKGKRVTNASGGYSYHNYSLAFDFCLIIDGNKVSWDINEDYDKDGTSDWQEVIKVFTDKGYESGGIWTLRDWPHIQKTFGYSCRALLEKYNGGKTFVENGIKYVIL